MNSSQNTLDTKAQKEHQLENEKARAKELSDLTTVLGTACGRRVMWKLMGDCGVFESIWEPSAKIHFNAGKHDLGLLWLKEMTEASPKLYLQMQKEQMDSSSNGGPNG